MGLEREFEKIYANADLRQEIPEPVNIKTDELSSEFDSELELTVLENREQEILDECNMMNSRHTPHESQLPLRREPISFPNISQQLNEKTRPSTTTTTAATMGTSSTTMSIATTGPTSTTATTSTVNSNVTKNPNQETALQKLLIKIRQQREESTKNKDTDAETTPVQTPKHASRKFCSKFLTVNL